ncbi:MAG: putative dsRNA-binding protein [Candidatus Limnocylindrales bacterium]
MTKGCCRLAAPRSCPPPAWPDSPPGSISVRSSDWARGVAAPRAFATVPPGVVLRGRGRRHLSRPRVRGDARLAGRPGGTGTFGRALHRVAQERQESPPGIQPASQWRAAGLSRRGCDRTRSRRSFRIEVWVDGEMLGVGSGPSRRVAETAAAGQAIAELQEHPSGPVRVL